VKTPGWSSVKRLFEEALKLPAAERGAFLTAQNEDEGVLAEVRSLLSVYEESPDFLDGANSAQTGKRIGAWRLVREIGRGGMGVVWEAQRADQHYEQRVAIKLLPAGLLSSAEVARFREERQILARLNHPGIAHLLDGGATEDGSPYLVMEYIEGERLDDWIERSKPSLEEKLRLFLTVLAAVEYAHRRLVIHRDLKPANILVSADGSAKLLDFGIARLVDAENKAPAATVRRLTPEYASPEQVRGEEATTASDIYSLGVLLYKLVTGRRPYAAGTEDALAMLKAICEEEPRLPSAAAGVARLRGEMDAIVLACLRKNPEERYATVRALADDVAAWLDGRPVSAHRPPWWRRSLKFVRRHKMQSAAAAAVAASILAGSGVSLWYAQAARRQSRIAETRFSQVRRLANSVVFELHDAIEDLPGSTAARKLLVERALEYLTDLEATGPGGDLELQLEVAAAYRRVGDVQGNPSRPNLGDAQGAIASYRKARGVLEEAGRRAPPDPRVLRALGDVAGCLADMYELRSDLKRALELRKEAARSLREAARFDPGIQARKAAALANWNLAAALNLTGDWKEAADAWSEVLASYQEIARLEAGRSAAQRNVALAHKRLGAVQAKLGEFDPALSHYQAAIGIDRRRMNADPSDAEAAMDASFDEADIGWIYGELGRHRLAAESFERALSLRRKLAAADPKDYRQAVGIARLEMRVALAYTRLGESGKAGAAFRKGTEMFGQALRHNPADQEARLQFVRSLGNLAEASLSAGMRSLAADCIRRATSAARDLKPGALTPEEQATLAGLAASI
jgi:tetratricopeptide (TPR) repeat protein